MPSTQVVLVASTISTIQLDAPAGRVVLTQEAGTPGEVYATCDGTNPVIPSTGVEVSGGQVTLGSFLGAQTVLSPQLYGDHMVAAQIRIISAGTPTVGVAW